MGMALVADDDQAGPAVKLTDGLRGGHPRRAISDDYKLACPPGHVRLVRGLKRGAQLQTQRQSRAAGDALAASQAVGINHRGSNPSVGPHIDAGRAVEGTDSTLAAGEWVRHYLA